MSDLPAAPPPADGPAPQGIDELRAAIEQVQALVRTVAWGVSKETDALTELVGTLTARVDKLTPAGPATDEDEPAPAAWVDYATAQDWADLAEWVDWFADTYDVVPGRAVLRCWPAHRGVAEELAALRSSWRAAAIAAQANEPSDALIVWHDRWLHPCLVRLHEGFQQKNCVDAHAASRPRQLTDQALLTAALPKDAKNPGRENPTSKMVT